MGFHAEQRDYDVVIVGAGPAGLGVGAALARLEQVNFVVLEREAVGASFRNWHDKMRMITPSFNAGGFGYPDLNAIAPRTSPAYSIRTEHPTGQEYADYLEAFADHYELPVQTGVAVAGVVPDGAGFVVQTSAGDFRARFVVWAAGEFFYPRIPSIPGSQWGVHFGAVRQWEPIEGSRFVVIGGYESGVDAAINLSRLGKRVTVLERTSVWSDDAPDPSLALSPYTWDRLRAEHARGNIEMVAGAEAVAIERTRDGYVVYDSEGCAYPSDAPPILATGFQTSARLIAPLLEWREDGFPLVTATDESTLTPNLFLAGPALRHDDIIFCFIYKFRQRFPVIAATIAARMGIDAAPLEEYRLYNMYLDDLSCCDDTCEC